MILSVRRFEFGGTCTIGHLFIDGSPSGLFTLEDVVREVKIPGETAIPCGTYRVIVDHSNHFGKDLPHILDVPGFEGVRIHPGNTDKETEGCILVGKTWSGGDFIGQSREAFDELFANINSADNVTIEIV